MHIGPHTCMSGYVSAYHGVGKLCILLHTILCHAVYQVSIPDVILDYTETFATVMNRTDTVCVRRFHDAFNAAFYSKLTKP